MTQMAVNDIRKLIDSLPQEKKEALLSSLEKQAGISSDALNKAVAGPNTADKLNRLASQIDVSALNKLASDPAKLSALLSSPQIKNALKNFLK